MTDESKPDSFHFFTSYDDLSDSSCSSSDEDDEGEKKSKETSGREAAQQPDKLDTNVPLPKPDELFKSVSKPAFLHNPLNKQIDWESRAVKAPEEVTLNGLCIAPMPAQLFGVLNYLQFAHFVIHLVFGSSSLPKSLNPGNPVQCPLPSRMHHSQRGRELRLAWTWPSSGPMSMRTTGRTHRSLLLARHTFFQMRNKPLIQVGSKGLMTLEIAVFI